MLCLQIFPDSSYGDDWVISNDHSSTLIYSDSFSGKSSVAMGARRRRSSSTGDVELVQKDINKAVKLMADDNTMVTDTMVTKQKLLPVKMEAIGTPSSIDSTEELALHSITMVKQEAIRTDEIINLDTSVANDNKKSSEC